MVARSRAFPPVIMGIFRESFLLRIGDDVLEIERGGGEENFRLARGDFGGSLYISLLFWLLARKSSSDLHLRGNLVLIGWLMYNCSIYLTISIIKRLGQTVKSNTLCWELLSSLLSLSGNLNTLWLLIFMCFWEKMLEGIIELLTVLQICLIQN